jgi:hypothetical protein
MQQVPWTPGALDREEEAQQLRLGGEAVWHSAELQPRALSPGLCLHPANALGWAGTSCVGEPSPCPEGGTSLDSRDVGHEACHQAEPQAPLLVLSE